MNSKPPLILINTLIFSLTALAAVILAPLHGVLIGYQTETLVLAVLFWIWNGLSITAGYHRFWSHKAYSAHPAVQWFLAIGGAMAMQNSILHWASDHRRHHRFVDDDIKDPYSASRGFWYSHIGWMLRNYQGKPDYTNARDLQKNPIVMFQHRHYTLLVLITNVVTPLVCGALIGDLWGTLLMAGAVRLVAMHHGTFFINSLAHIWGSQPYSDKQSSRDNGLLALFTFGEGYHNFHHTFEYDWRNGIRWFHYDPTKWLIGLLAKVKLASDLREVPAERIETTKLKMQLKLSRAVAHDRGLSEEWLNRLEQQYQSLTDRMGDYYQAKQVYLKQTRQQLDASTQARLKDLKACLKEQQQQWLKLRQQMSSAKSLG